MSGRRTLIIGLGITGMSCVRYLYGLLGPDRLLIADTRTEPPGLDLLRHDFPDVTVMVGATDLDFEGVDRILVSPGVSLTDPILAGLPDDVSLVSDVDLFCDAARVPIIAATGTNGKSTVTSLVGHLLQRSGVNAVVGGNLGEAALDLLSDAAELYVLELSSFQLERLARHHFLAATILNVSEDHLDRHGDMSAYVAAKQRIYRDCALAVANRADRLTFPVTDGALVTFGEDEPAAGQWGLRLLDGQRWLARGDEPVVPASELPIAGRHNEQNVLAALALADAAGVAIDSMREAVRTFEGLRHRCERVAEVNGVEYINDSKATNVGATRAALMGLGRGEGAAHIVLIAGGDGKGADFTPLKEMVDRYVRVLLLIGRDAPLLARALADVTQVRCVSTMDEAVAEAAVLAHAGELVLLSPACASLDMYPNFAARGNHFAQAVEALAA
jgi:UDP-N-acetylmuramoylalanine--D-glutamate ligase